MSSWHKFTGRYVKKFYELRMRKNGEIVRCWPNAGRMNAVDSTGRQWPPSANVEVRVAKNQDLSEDADLQYCDVCIQMTNHINGRCLKHND